MKTLVIALTIALIQFSASSQERIKILVSSRVDTNNTTIKEVFDTYCNYLNARPDSIYDNPYWNKTEKEAYHDFDLSRLSMFQTGMNSIQLFKVFVPFIMSIEPLGSKYQIRTLFSSSTIDPAYAGSKVWCIQKLNVIEEDGHWVLENLIQEINENWSSTQADFINYRYPTTHDFNIENADKSIEFCKDITQRFNPNYNSSFTYYLTDNVDQLGLLENFDYFFTGLTKGKVRNAAIFSANGNEFYPHEVIHKILPENPKRGYVIEEGFAMFLGTKMDSSKYASDLERLTKDLKTNPETINFESVLTQKVAYNGYQTAYPGGAAICELISKLEGDNGLQKLLIMDTSNYNTLLQTLETITGFSKEEIAAEWEGILNK